MEFTKKEVLEYLNDYCTKVRSNESCEYTELMMDNHKCIVYNNKMYYIPDSFSSNYEMDMFDYLVDNFLY